MIVLLNAFDNLLAAVLYAVEFDTCHKTNRMIGLQIGDHCRECFPPGNCFPLILQRGKLTKRGRGAKL